MQNLACNDVSCSKTECKFSLDYTGPEKQIYLQPKLHLQKDNKLSALLTVGDYQHNNSNSNNNTNIVEIHNYPDL